MIPTLQVQQKLSKHSGTIIQWKEQLQQMQSGCVLVIGYAPSILMSACAAIKRGEIQPALVIGMPIGFSHAPAAKRRLMLSKMPHITIEGTLGGGLLAAVALNALTESLLDKPECHCYLEVDKLVELGLEVQP